MISLSLTEAQSLTALRSFLLAVLPVDTPVVRGQDNRVPEPIEGDYVTMIPLFRQRIETNVDDYIDAVFTGSIAGTTLTITDVGYGALAEGRQIFGADVAANTVITALGSGTGGIGTYTVNNAQTVSSQTIAAGAFSSLQPVQLTVQLDVHGPASADNAHIISTLFRDGYCVDAFNDSGFDVAPLYCVDPRQMPFSNDQQQIENRWTIDVVMQCNPVVSGPQQFFADLKLQIIALIGDSITATFWDDSETVWDDGETFWDSTVVSAP